MAKINKVFVENI